MKIILLLLALAGCPSPEHPAPTGALALIEASKDLDGTVVGTAKTPTVVVLMASWCGHCRAQLADLARLRTAHPTVRILAVNYKGHEEYDNRGNAAALRAFVMKDHPWLRVVPADEQLFSVLGRPPTIPTLWVFAANGKQAAFYDRSQREPPTLDELEAMLAKLGA